MTKRYLSILLLLVTMTCSLLQATPVTVEITTAGQGEALFASHTTATEMVIKGKMNHLDLMALRAACRQLELLDLSEVSIVEYEDAESYVTYPANELSVALASSSNLKTLILPEGLKKIASKALYKCPKLESITLPGSTIPKLPNARAQFVETKQMKLVTLYVPADMLEAYKKKQTENGWKFKEIKEIPAADPWEKLEWDNVYGDNLYPLSKDKERKIFMAAYFTNNTTETVNKIEFSYWYDNDEPKTVTMSNTQLLPGATTPDGQGFLIFDAPEDNDPHLFSIRPTKVNDMPVTKSVRCRPVRTYLVDNTFRRPTQLVETVIDPSDEDCMERYGNVIHSIVRIEAKTKQPGRHELITMVGKTQDGALVIDSPAKEIVETYKVPGVARLMFNRALMTPYGTLNNDQELLGIVPYTPAVKIDKDLLNINEYLFSRAFNKPGFATITPVLKYDKTNKKFLLSCSGELSLDESTKADHRLSVYLVENTEFPAFDAETESVEVPIDAVYRKLVRRLSPAEGYKVVVNEQRKYIAEVEPFAIDDYVSGKLRLVAIIHREGEKQPCVNGVLQSAGLVLSDENITHTELPESSFATPALLRTGEGTLSTDSSQWSVEAIYTTDGCALSATSPLSVGKYVVILKHITGLQRPVKFIINE